MRDVFRNSFNPRGRLSRAGYWWAWLGIFVINVILGIFNKILFLNDTLHLYWLASLGILVWKIAVFFPMLFAAVRRYHDCGEAGWMAVLIDASGRICHVSGCVMAVITLLFYAICADASASEAGFYGLMAFSGLLILAGFILNILDIIFLTRPSEPGENAYGRPAPFVCCDAEKDR